MGWERQKPVVAEQPQPPSAARWVLSGVLAVIAGILLFILHASGLLGALNSINIWLCSLIPAVLWILIFCIRGYLYGRELEHFQFLQHEAEYAQQQWTSWAERYLAILANCVLLPDHISASLLQQNARGLQQQQGLVRRIDYLPEDKALLTVLLDTVKEPLSSLPADLPLQVTLLTDEPESMRQKWYALLTDAWQESLPGQPAPSALTVTDQLSFHSLDERLKQPDATAQLLLVMQMHGEERYSDALSAMLFTSDDVAQKYSLSHDVRILRPMQLDMNNFAGDMALFLTTQTQATKTVAIWGDKQEWTASSAALISSGDTHGASWLAENIQTIETYCGIPGPFSPWFTAALGTDFVRIGQQSWLGLSTTGAENFVYTIASGSGDESVK